jgi:hypothetical protein
VLCCAPAVVLAPCLHWLQAQGLGVALAKGMRHLLDSSASAAEAADPAADAALAASATAQHTLGLHTLSALLAADLSGGVASSLADAGILGAVLDSLGSATMLRMHAAPNLLRASITLTEAHFVFLQVRDVPPVATCCHR